MGRLILVVGLLASAACMDTGTGFADVTGMAFQTGQVPIANSSVAISCSGGAIRNTVATDSVGRYQVSLASSAGGRIRCLFGAPGLTNPIARADTTVGFGPAGEPHALQFVNLEPVVVVP